MFDPPNVTVFCGSSSGTQPAYAEAARRFGRVLVERGLGLVYGGGNCGIMGTLADTVLAAGGRVTGVIPDFLVESEHAHRGVHLVIVSSMHERKARMAELAGAFAALPGGLGTFEELLEVLTWSQLGIHPKPIGILEVAGYFEPLFALLDRATRDGFLRPPDRSRLIAASEPERLLDELSASKVIPSSIVHLRKRT